MLDWITTRDRYGETFWRAHHDAWCQSALNQREYCEAHGLPLKAFGNWRAKFKAEPQPTRKLLYRRGGQAARNLRSCFPRDELQATFVADRIRNEVASHSMKAEETSFNLTVSIGVAAATLSMSGVEALMRAADEALYSAKSQDRNKVVWLTPSAAPRLAAE